MARTKEREGVEQRQEAQARARATLRAKSYLGVPDCACWLTLCLVYDESLLFARRDKCGDQAKEVLRKLKDMMTRLNVDAFCIGNKDAVKVGGHGRPRDLAKPLERRIFKSMLNPKLCRPTLSNARGASSPISSAPTPLLRSCAEHPEGTSDQRRGVRKQSRPPSAQSSQEAPSAQHSVAGRTLAITTKPVRVKGVENPSVSPRHTVRRRAGG